MKIGLSGCVNNFYVAIAGDISFTIRMNITADKTQFQSILAQFNPDSHVKNRMLALFSAAVTFDDAFITENSIQKAIKFQVERADLYEIILQSYLFLGFPRMLQAADVLQKVVPLGKTDDKNIDFLSENNLSDWYKDGVEVCKNVYKDKYEPLKNRVLDFAPEIFHWMILEGYGKVLSRNSLPLVTRELSIVSFLTMENRERQLHSHILGSLNVGASKELVKTVVDDIGVAAGDGYITALSIINGLKDKE